MSIIFANTSRIETYLYGQGHNDEHIPQLLSALGDATLAAELASKSYQLDHHELSRLGPYAM
jgi:hypothetical protein